MGVVWKKMWRVGESRRKGKESVKEVVGCFRRVVEEIVVQEKMSKKNGRNGGLFVLFLLLYPLDSSLLFVLVSG